MKLTPDLVAEVRAVAREELERYGTPWAEHMALRQLVWDRFNSLPSDEAALLAQLLSALDELGIRELLTAVELLEKGMVARGPGGDRLRLVYARFVDRPHPGKAFGRFLTRCSFVPVGCHYLCRVSPSSKSESALYRLAGFSPQLPGAAVALAANTAQDAGFINLHRSA